MINVANKKNNAILIAGIILFRIVLGFALFYFVFPHYPQRYTKNITVLNVALSVTFFIASLILIAKIYRNREKLSSSLIIVLLIYLISYIPGNLLIAYCGYELQYIFMFNIFWFLMLLLSDFVSRRKHRFYIMPRSEYEFYKQKQGLSERTILIIDEKQTLPIKWIYVAFILLLSAYALLLSYRFNGLKITISFDDIYDMREEASGFFGTFDALFINIFSTTVLPISIGFALKKKKILMVIWLFFMTLVMFSIGGNKSYLLVVVASLIVFPIISDDIIKKIPIIMATGLAVLLILHKLTSEAKLIDYAVDIIIRRTMFTPSEIGYSYYQFFQENPSIWLADDALIVRLGWTGPYNETPLSTVVGMAMYGTTGINNGLFGNAMGEFGNWGIVIFPVMFAFFAWLIDGCTFNVETKAVFSFFVSYVIILPNTSIAGVLYTFILPLFGLSVLYKISGQAYFKDKSEIKFEKFISKFKRNR